MVGFLTEAGIKEIPIWLVGKDYVNEQDQPFVRQLWFSGLDDRSGLGGYGWVLHCGDYWLFGVQKSGEAAQKKSAPKVETYTQKQIREALKDLGFSGLEKQLIHTLKK